MSLRTTEGQPSATPPKNQRLNMRVAAHQTREVEEELANIQGQRNPIITAAIRHSEWTKRVFFFTIFAISVFVSLRCPLFPPTEEGDCDLQQSRTILTKTFASFSGSGHPRISFEPEKEDPNVQRLLSLALVLFPIFAVLYAKQAIDQCLPQAVDWRVKDKSLKLRKYDLSAPENETLVKDHGQLMQKVLAATEVIVLLILIWTLDSMGNGCLA